VMCTGETLRFASGTKLPFWGWVAKRQVSGVSFFHEP